MVQAVEFKYSPNYIYFSDGRLFSKLQNKFMKILFSKRSKKEGKSTHYPKYKIEGKKNLPIHRLQAEHFIPKVPGKDYVLHLDDNPLNYQLSNIRWGDQSENMKMYWNRKLQGVN